MSDAASAASFFYLHTTKRSFFSYVTYANNITKRRRRSSGRHCLMSVLRITNNQERLLGSTHPHFAPKIGCIGVLSGYLTKTDEIKTKKWVYFIPELNTQKFKDNFKKNIVPFFSKNRLLNNVETMREITKRMYDDLYMQFNNADYVYRLNSDIYSYFIRILPYRGIFYIYAYLKDSVEKHLKAAKAGVTFVDMKNKVLFTVPDGDQIMIVYDQSTKQPRTVRYINEKFFQVGNYIYTPHEFADCMDDIEAYILPLRSSLPKYCYKYDEENDKLLLIKKGYGNYFPHGRKIDSLTGEEEVKQLNQKLGVTDEQVKAMIAGVEKGWDSPYADPEIYREENQENV